MMSSSCPPCGQSLLHVAVVLRGRLKSIVVGLSMLALLLLGGCRSVSALTSDWRIAVDGDVKEAAAALNRAAVESGGAVLSAPSDVGSSYAFGTDVVGFRVQGSDVAMFVGTSTSMPALKTHAERRMEALARRIVTRASETSRLALRLQRASDSSSAAMMPSAESRSPEPAIEAANPRMKEFAAYLERLADTVQREFDRVVMAGNVYPPPKTYVKVRFLLLPDGRVGEILGVDNHTTDHGMKAALSAITNPAPFPAWSDAMKATLDPHGEELAFTFYYQ